MNRQNYFDTGIEFLKGVGPQKAVLLHNELNIFTYGDLLEHYPFRYEDRTSFVKIAELTENMASIQLKGRLRDFTVTGEGFKKRLVAHFGDGSGSLELVWFQGVAWFEKSLKRNGDYVVYGKPVLFGGKFSITHPEIEPLTPQNERGGFYQPVYHLTEKLKKRYIDSRFLGRTIQVLLEQSYKNIHETLPESLINKYRLVSKASAMYYVHLPASMEHVQQAQRRLKFEEFFYNQLRLVKNRILHRTEFPGQIFGNDIVVTDFLQNQMPFALTGAQVRVLDEIFVDLKSGKQMNRLLQGDVGSGKTIVAFLSILLALGSGAQACLMAPTEILADQHFQGLKQFADRIGVSIGKLTGSTKKKERELLHAQLIDGTLQLIVGTHALLEDIVQFNNLGLCIIDEQHRFGVAQRSRLWLKNKRVPPHILVMTATPIPRTLAMTVWGDLEISSIDELPAGRKPIKTVHRFDSHRLAVFGFVREEIEKGRQVYIVYPLIDESEKSDLKDLMDGYESVARAFPGIPLSILHGKMPSRDKDFEMSRFVKGETRIMVATTVIEVGINVPNASVMIIENAERFGLSQLHQLRGRVGRGAEQSYCILMTSYKLSQDTRVRVETMCRTNDGFEIAEVDLQLRGPGDLTGTRQSGLMDFKIADLAKDGEILKAARISAQSILEQDPDLEQPENIAIKRHIESLGKEATNWGRIS